MDVIGVVIVKDIDIFMASEGGDRISAGKVAGDKIFEFLVLCKGCGVDNTTLEGVAPRSVVPFFGGSNSLGDEVHVTVDRVVRF